MNGHRCVMVAMLALVSACTAGSSEAARVCQPDIRGVVETGRSSAEDIVGAETSDLTELYFVSERGRDLLGPSSGEDDDRSRIATFAVREGQIDQQTELLWRPPDDQGFMPLGMSFLPADQSGIAELFVIDHFAPAKIWRLRFAEDNLLEPMSADIYYTETNGELTHANNLAAIRNDGSVHLYVTRFDLAGFLPWTKDPWPGVLKIEDPDQPAVEHVQGLQGANGIVDLGADKPLLMADYWGKSLWLVPKTEGTAGIDAIEIVLDDLPIYVDNISLDGERVLLAGSRNFFLSTINFLIPRSPSPSAVLALNRDDLTPPVQPVPIWQGSFFASGSVSVAVGRPGGLALGQITSSGILKVDCEDQPS